MEKSSRKRKVIAALSLLEMLQVPSMLTFLPYELARNFKERCALAPTEHC